MQLAQLRWKYDDVCRRVVYIVMRVFLFYILMEVLFVKQIIIQY